MTNTKLELPENFKAQQRQLELYSQLTRDEQKQIDQISAAFGAIRLIAELYEKNKSKRK